MEESVGLLAGQKGDDLSQKGAKRVVWDPELPPDSYYERLILWTPKDFSFLSPSILRQRCWLLCLVMLVFATAPALVKGILSAEGTTPAALNLWRFLAAALAAAPWAPGVGAHDCLGGAPPAAAAAAPAGRPPKPPLEAREKWWLALQMGFWQFLSVTFMAVGLRTTQACRGAVLLHVHVLVLPLAAGAVYGRRLDFPGWFRFLGCVLGVAMLTAAEGPAQVVGDIWCLAAAVARGLLILTLEHSRRRASAMELNSASLCIATVINVLSFILSKQNVSVVGATLAAGPWALVFLGAGGSAFVMPAMSWGKRSIPAKEWAVLHILGTVFSSLFAMWYLEERLGIVECIGALAILSSVYAQQQDSVSTQSIFSPHQQQKNKGKKSHHHHQHNHLFQNNDHFIPNREQFIQKEVHLPLPGGDAPSNISNEL